jgi:ATP adenylyltransferase
VVIVSDERLWAPWRLEYVTGAESSAPEPPPEPLDWQPNSDRACFLCRAAARHRDPLAADRELLVVARGTHTLVVLNRYPYNNGHLMVATLRHIGIFADVADAEHVEAIHWLGQLMGVFDARMRPDGYNIGLNLGRIAGAGLPGHLHWHLVPRWSGDSNFMSVTAGTRVIPQSLDALWEMVTASLSHRAADG